MMRKFFFTGLLIILLFSATAQEKKASYNSIISPTVELQAGTHIALAYPEQDVQRHFMGNGSLLLGCDILLPQGMLTFCTGFKVGHHHYTASAYQMNAFFYGIPLLAGYEYLFPSQISIWGQVGLSFYKLGTYNLKLVGKTSGLPYQQQVEECLKNRWWHTADIEMGLGYQFHSNLSFRVSLCALIPFRSTKDNPYLIVANTIRPLMGLKMGLKWNILSR